MRTGAFLAASTILLILSGSASAEVRLEGYLIALSDCAANKKKDSDNPGNVRLEVLHAYEMLARNATPGTHYQVKVPGAPQTIEQKIRGRDAPADWVLLICGYDVEAVKAVVSDRLAPEELEAHGVAPGAVEGLYRSAYSLTSKDLP